MSDDESLENSLSLVDAIVNKGVLRGVIGPADRKALERVLNAYKELVANNPLREQVLRHMETISRLEQEIKDLKQTIDQLQDSAYEAMGEDN